MNGFRITFILMLRFIQIGLFILLGVLMIVTWANRFTFPERTTGAMAFIIIGGSFMAIEGIIRFSRWFKRSPKEIRSYR